MNNINRSHLATKLFGTVLVMTAEILLAVHNVQAATSITTCTGLQNIQNNLSGSYVLANNIDCTNFSSEGFTPIGSIGSPFTGTLDGQGYTVNALEVDGLTGYAGVFLATSSSAIIKNIGFTNVMITGSSYTGGIVGQNKGLVENSYTTGSVSAFGAAYPGSIVGDNNAGHVLNDYSTASVTATSYAGGLVGINQNAGTVVDSYATGALSGGAAGGLVGLNVSGTVTDSFWDTQTSGANNTSGGGTGKTTAQMKTQSTYTNWDFNAIWTILSTVNSGYPYLDTNVPIVTNVTSTKANGLYGLGTVIDVNVTFSRAVTSTGNVTVTLETGATDRTCTFTVTNATTGTCNYTVQAGDATDLLTVNSVTGTIEDSVWHVLTNTTPATNLAANKTLIIETTAPTPTLTTSAVTNGGSTSLTPPAFRVTFSETVTGFTADDITVTNGTVGDFVANNTTMYDFSVTPTAAGLVTIDIPAGAAIDSAGNPSAAATQYTFTYSPTTTTTSPATGTINTVTQTNGTLTVVYNDGTSEQITPFKSNTNFTYTITPDNNSIIVTNAVFVRIYTHNRKIASATVGKTKLKTGTYSVNVTQFYNGYQTIVVATPTSMTVFRLTTKNKLTHKRVVTFKNATGKCPVVTFNSVKKNIILTLNTSKKYTWKLLKTGKLQVVK